METDWLVLRTRYRQELKVAAILQIREFTPYVPVRQEVRKWSDRKKSITIPIFPGYIFVKQNNQELQVLNYIPGSAGLLMHSGKISKCSDRNIEEIKALEASRMSFKSHNRLYYGEKVKIVRGPLAGMEGQFLRMKSETRFILNAVVLKQSVSIEINLEDISRI